MVIFGLVLLLLVALLVIAVVANGGDPASLDLQLFTIGTNVTGVFVAGAVTLLLGVLGLWLVAKGVKHDRSRRSQIKDLRKQASRRGGKAASPAAATTVSQSSTRSGSPAAGATSGSGATSGAATGTRSPDSASAGPGGPASSGSAGGSTSAGAGGSAPGAAQRRDDGTDDHFESTPRDPAS